MDVNTVPKWLQRIIIETAKEHGYSIKPLGAPVNPNWYNEKTFFQMAGVRADGHILQLNILKKESHREFEVRFEELLQIKEGFREILEISEVKALLNGAFSVDGAIKISESEIKELISLPYGVDINPQDVQSEIDRIISAFTYPVAKNKVFRGKSYYFMLEGLSVDTKTRFSSVNNYEINGLNYPVFCRSLIRHYRSINDSICFVASHLMCELRGRMPSAKDKLCRELLNKISPKKLKAFRKKASGGNYYVGHENTDQFFEQQWEQVLEELDDLRQVVDRYRKTGSNFDLNQLVTFLSYRSSAIRHAKVIFGLDIDAVFNKHLKLSPSRAYRKLILGLLDAKINILAFCQNASQILYSSDFLNCDFPGSLVFRQDAVRNMVAVYPGGFKFFKKSQEIAKGNLRNLSLLAELEEATALYVDVLLNDNSASYNRLAGVLYSDENFMLPSQYGSCPSELRDPLTLMGHFFSFLDGYCEIFEAQQLKKQVKSLSRGKPFKRAEAHVKARRDAWTKLIRIYREENDPLVMLFTAQHAAGVIKRKGFDPMRDVLHTMSVNYGGALVGLYAKHTLSRMIPGGQVVANTGALVYSIYDVKNANSFSKLSDYPYSSIANDMTLDQTTKQRLKSENWLLIFDDNTNSGETVDNIRQLAEESDLYGRIDTFTCRASADARKFKRSLTKEQQLDIVGVSGLRARKAKIIGAGERYKEIIGTVVGHRLFKLNKQLAKP